VMYYFAIITSIMMHIDDPGETNHPCLRAGCHSYCVTPGFKAKPNAHSMCAQEKVFT
jgi:hypothetical protein